MVSGREDKRFLICLNLDGGLDPGQTYGKLDKPVFAMYGDRRKPQQPGESREAFDNRTASRNRSLDQLKAPYQEAAKGSYFLLVDSPGFSHFSYYDFPNAQAEEPMLSHGCFRRVQDWDTLKQSRGSRVQSVYRSD